MPNEKGWLTRDEVIVTGLPLYILPQGIWHGRRPTGGLMMTECRCAELGAPIAADEGAAGYAYNPTLRSKYRYVPLYYRIREQLDVTQIGIAERRMLTMLETGKVPEL